MATSRVETPPLGKNGPKTARIGTGLMAPSGVYSLPGLDEEPFKFLDEAFEAGATFWGTGKLLWHHGCQAESKTVSLIDKANLVRPS